MLMSVAATRVDDSTAGSWWSLQIVLNAIWSPVFFGARRIRLALVIIVGLWIAVLG